MELRRLCNCPQLDGKNNTDLDDAGDKSDGGDDSDCDDVPMLTMILM
mgnify:CR=1 FL=1